MRRSQIRQICQNVSQVSHLFASLGISWVSRSVSSREMSQVDLQSPGAFAGRWGRFALGQGDDMRR